MPSPLAATIAQRLSLRQPLREALNVVADLTETLPLKKGTDLAAALEIVRAAHPGTVTSFGRAFPSLALAIATGVGKTRLMGACIAYLHLQHGIRNFFILAPNLTIYQKLMEDFGNPAHPKYVFQGISEFVHNRPVLITGDNYNQQGQLFKDTEVRINVFNVAKFAADSKPTTKAGQRKPPLMKRLNETLGESYWKYLTSLPDLVLLMDEAHRYHGGATTAALNELNPVLGLELTATPIDVQGQPFRNVVYEYSLARALDDGLYVKKPTIATRRDYRTEGKTDLEIQYDKLEDGLSLHEEARTALDLYAATEGVSPVKPFVLVVCRDINHARATAEYLESDAFFHAKYRGKVLRIDSETRTSDEVEQLFLTLESPDNAVEIVLHVAMLKEGWDVTNLYTIVPLNAANAPILIEQTIGRGLRLPYQGQRTGNDKVDRLTVVAHDTFAQVIRAAENPDSILNKLSFVEIEREELQAGTEVVTAPSRVAVELAQQATAVAALPAGPARQQAQTSLDAKKAILNVLPTLGAATGVRSYADLAKPEVQQRVIAKIEQQLNTGQLNVFAAEVVAEAKAQYQAVVTSFRQHLIEIPRMDLVQEEVKVWFEPFTLDVSNGQFNRQLRPEEIVVRGLRNRDGGQEIVGVRHGAANTSTPANQLIAEVLNHAPDVDYDDNAHLLHQLATVAVTTLSANLANPADLPSLMRQQGHSVAIEVYRQLQSHFRMSDPTYREPDVLPFSSIIDWNFTALTQNGYKDYRENVLPRNTVSRYVYRGFAKACHFEYKFDSTPEKDFAQMLEGDAVVLRWLRPAPRQFRLYWNQNANKYEPDFVVETATAIYIAEVKAANEITSAEVLDKARAACTYCRYASAYTSANGGKPWHYLLIPAEDIRTTDSFARFVADYRYGVE